MAYSANLEKVKEIIRNLAKAHPSFIDTRNENDKKSGVSAVPIYVTTLGNSSVTIQASVWCRHSTAVWAMKCELLESILTNFRNADIEIPYNKQDVYLYNKTN